MPSSDDRSDVPMSSTSMPSTAAMSAAFFTASGLSIITTVRISSLIAFCASAIAGGW